ncbi:MAG: sugar phosphate nucleotidyltransferase, partial [Thermoanaerobaculia bacterium]|nr:sugar phosphate nucleotidyltransferase [Thermoanaerobaculia bacterium]
MPHPVHRAVVPAAGRGTRMVPFSAVVPKELAPVGSTPLLHFVLDEAVSAGIDELAIVSNATKSLLSDYVDWAQGEGHWPDLAVRWVEQARPDGLADAIYRCRDFCSGEAFGLLLPDNLPLAPDYRFRALVEAASTTGLHAIAVLELDHAASGLYGNCGRIRHQPRAD